MFLSLGIICGNFFSSDSLYYIIFGIALILILLNSIISTLCKNKFKEWVFFLSFPILFFSLGAVLIGNKVEKIIVDIPVKDASYLVEIQSVPIIKDKYCTADARVIYSFDSVCCKLQNHKVLVKFNIDSLFVAPSLGDRYIISTAFYTPSKNIVSSFDYGSYLNVNGYSKVGYVYDDIVFVENSGSYSLSEKFLLLREKLISVYKTFDINKENLSVLSAITLGEKNMLSNDTKSNFSAAGVSHVLVVSGMHVGFIFMIISALYGRFYNRKYRIIITVLGIIILWMYALLTGFAPSVVRASFMFSLMLAFKLFGNKYRVIHALFFSATISLLFNPALLFNVSFQLSYLAVFSIVVFYNNIYHFFIDKIPGFIGKEKFFSVISVTLAAQILTCPVVMYYFHQFPTFFVISNLCVVIFAPIIFIGGYMLICFSFIPILSSFIASVLNIILTAFYYFIDFIANIKYAVTDVYISLFQCLFLYVIILFIANYMYCNKDNKVASLVCLLCMVLMFSITVSYNTVANHNKDVLCIGDRKSLMVNVFNSKNNYLFVNENINVDNFDVWLKYGAPTPVIIKDSLLYNNTFEFDSQSYCILRNNIFRYKTTYSQPLAVDNLIIDRGVYPSPKLFEKFITPKFVIFTNGVYKGYIPKYKELLDNKGIPYYFISEDGEYYKIKKSYKQ